MGCWWLLVKDGLDQRQILRKKSAAFVKLLAKPQKEFLHLVSVFFMLRVAPRLKEIVRRIKVQTSLVERIEERLYLLGAFCE
jgi:hypothetical protein